LFDPASLPDLLSELLINDEANKRAVSVQVVQRTVAGVVRGIATPPADTMPRGATVLNTGRQTATPVYQIRYNPIAEAKISRKIAAGRHPGAETQLLVLRQQKAYQRVVTPFDGVVTRRNIARRA
jgi:F0F1-type ATP synthase beta subunit